MATSDLPAPGSTERTRIRRLPEKAVTEREVAYAILDAALMAHVGVTVDGQPFVVPVACARRDDEVIFHGSSASRLFTSLAAGAPTCLTVTLLDGLVLARSLFESSMHYRSIMVLGVARVLTGDDEIDALLALSEHLMPGRTTEARHPTAKELKATITLALPLDEMSVKVGDGPPDDVPSDLVEQPYAGVWAGSVPIECTYGVPVADEQAASVPVPTYIEGWRWP